MTKKAKNVLRSTLYVIVGSVVFIAAIAFVLFLYFSTVLPGMHIIRYTLYAISFIIMILSGWFVGEGKRYLVAQIERRR